MRKRRIFITSVYGMLCLPLWILILCLMMALTSCKSTEYVTVEKTTTDTLYINKVMRDSTYLSDSTLIYIKGDTIFRDRWHTLHVYHNYTDTLCRIRLVKDPQPYPVEKIVEVNKLYWWQETLMWSGAIFLLLVVGWIVLRIRKPK